MTKRLAVILGLLMLAVALVAASAQAGHKTQQVTNVTFAGWSSGPDEDALDQQMADKLSKSSGSKLVNAIVDKIEYAQAQRSGQTLMNRRKPHGITPTKPIDIKA